MKLYYSPGACSLAPHIALNEIGADFSIDRIKDKKTEAGEDFWGINPKGYVPALKLDDGSVLTEGVVLQQYIADLKPELGLVPPHGTKARREVEELLVYISTELHKGHSPLFTPGMPDDAKKLAKESITKRYALIEKQLSDGRAYLTGDKPTIADIYLFVITNWAKPTGLDLSSFPNIIALAGRIAARPATQAALKAEGLLG